MSMEKLQEFGAYQKALDLFDLVVADMQRLHDVHDTMRLRSQQIAAADSISSNMEEGAGRWSTGEYVQYLVISRGSAAETMGRYKRMRHWLQSDLVTDRVARCNEIIAILTKTISNLKRSKA